MMLENEYFEKDKIVYELAFEFLNNFGVDKGIIAKQYNHLVNPQNLSDLYQRMAESAQNKQMSLNVIGKSIGGVGNLRQVLFDFNVHEISKHFSIGEENALLQIIEDKLHADRDFRNNKRSLWPQYCKTLISAAHFFSQFDDFNSFKLWADDFAHDKKTQALLPVLISFEIYGIGFPLACDFLKEIGYRNFGKPDVHIINIFEQLDLIGKQFTAKNRDYLILQAIQRIAKNNNTDAYCVDKTFWLIGSGDFYSAGIKLKGKEKEFVEFVKRDTKYQKVFLIPV